MQYFRTNGISKEIVALLLSLILSPLHFAFAKECDGPDPVINFGESFDFVGLAVCVQEYFPFQNIKMFRVIDTIRGSNKMIMVAGSYGAGDGRQELSCEVGDTLLIQAYLREDDFIIEKTLISVIEQSPLYYFATCKFGYFRYKNGFCYYRFHDEEKVHKYSVLKKEILKRLRE